jgi:glycosyltransferase involved in cell wall biosynthesis
MVLAVFSYRYDAALVPDLLANIEPMVDGWVAFDDRDASELFSNEPGRRRLLIKRAKELGATWILAMDPDERIEFAGATRIRSLTAERQRVIWQFNLREMFTQSSYRVDGIWGSKMQGRLFPVFDGPLCSEQPLHGAWCVAPANYSIVPAGLNLYHLKLISHNRRLARRDLYHRLDPNHLYQKGGYDYLIDETNAKYEQIPPARDFFPTHRETGNENLYMAEALDELRDRRKGQHPTSKFFSLSCEPAEPKNGTTLASQLGELRISIGKNVRRDSKLAVVVIGLHAPKSLLNAVCSLIQQDTPPEIVVVNSGGGKISELLREHLQSVVLVELAQPVNVGAARNLGIQVSRAPFVAFLAGDCVAAPGWVAERIRAHMAGECAVGSVVENDKPWNPFAWAAHLMTYGHRMVGGMGAAVYGASYDRILFDKYGYFSEAMVIGEDSEFHSRFRPSDTIWLRPTIRTIHRNPAGPISFLEDQFHRGIRGRYLADFLGADFSAAYIAHTTVRRVARSVSLSVIGLRGKERSLAVCCWPLMPLGAAFYFAGMIVSHLKARIAERLFRQAEKAALFEAPPLSVTLLRRAIQLRPVTARYHEALGIFLGQLQQYDSSARELYASWDIGRSSIIDLYRRTRKETLLTKSPLQSIRLQVVVFCDSSVLHLAEFLKAVVHQGNLDIFVVETRATVLDSRAMLQVRQSYAHVAKFVSPKALMNSLSTENSHPNAPGQSFIVVSSSSCTPPSDWLAVLRAYIITYPEVKIFQGSCRPYESEGAGFIKRITSELKFFPRTVAQDGVLEFTHAATWACNRSLLIRSGGLTDNKMEALGVRTLMGRVMKAGGSSLYAPDWETWFQMDSTLTELLPRFYQDGYYAAKHGIVMKDRDITSIFFAGGRPRRLIIGAWRFAIKNFEVWRFTKRSLLLYGPAFLLLFLAGIARQIGWLMGVKRFGGYCL